ncbi:MAG: hypothetical protein KKD07_02010, partial [Candidatus Omnitrophica bacterium]|nr:hypothetical protein [Candidatus Omnitrophota bacterium]
FFKINIIFCHSHIICFYYLSLLSFIFLEIISRLKIAVIIVKEIIQTTRTSDQSLSNLTSMISLPKYPIIMRAKVTTEPDTININNENKDEIRTT